MMTLMESQIFATTVPKLRIRAKTTLMLTEAALCLAEDESKIAVGGGFWTPASAMGKLLRDRITTHAGLSFELIDDLRA